MAHKKGQGSTSNGRDSNPKYLGVKLFGGQLATAGNIIIRQRGTKYHVGQNVYLGRDHTVHAKVDGFVKFTKGRKDRTYVNIVPLTDEVLDAAQEAPKAAAPKKAKPAPKPKKVEAAPMAAAAPVVEEPKVEAPKKAAAPAKKAKVAKLDTVLGKIKPDDLKVVEGIGPKIEGLLQAGGFETWVKLGNAPVEALQTILDDAGSRYRMHNPGTWAAQSKMAAEGKWEELKKWQDELDGGK